MRIDDDIFESNIRGLARLIKSLDAKIDKLLVADRSIMDERLFDNQDLCLFLKVTPRTIQQKHTLLIFRVLTKILRVIGNDLETTQSHYPAFIFIDSNSFPYKDRQIFYTQK